MVNPRYPPLVWNPEEAGVQTAPPLGLAYIASVLEKNEAHKVEILDMQPLQMSYDQLAKYIEKKNPDVVGASATTYNFLQALKVMRIAKNVDSNTVTVIGGTHPSIVQEKILEFEDIDFAIYGEGELSFLNLVDSIENKRDPREVKGLVYRDSDGIRKTPPQPLTADLDEIPFPARHLLPMDRYERPATILTSRGCPYSCVYCTRSVFGKKWRARSPANVAEELSLLKHLYRPRWIDFLDDTFTLDRKRVIAICKEILKRNLRIRWRVIGGRVDHVESKMLEAMREAGCVFIIYGIESGSDEVLKAIKKGITVDQVERAVKLTRQAGIEVGGYFMIGNPGENRKKTADTVALAKKLNLDGAVLSFTTPYPGTELWKWVHQHGSFLISDFARYLDSHTGSVEPVFETEEFTKDERIITFREVEQALDQLVRQSQRVRLVNEIKKRQFGYLLRQTLLPPGHPRSWVKEFFRRWRRLIKNYSRVRAYRATMLKKNERKNSYAFIT